MPPLYEFDHQADTFCSRLLRKSREGRWRYAFLCRLFEGVSQLDDFRFAAGETFEVTRPSDIAFCISGMVASTTLNDFGADSFTWARRSIAVARMAIVPRVTHKVNRPDTTSFFRYLYYGFGTGPNSGGGIRCLVAAV